MSDLLAVSLDAVFDAIPVGLVVVDASRRIALINQAFRDALDLPHDAVPSGAPVQDAMRALALRGICGPGDPDAQVAAFMALDHSRFARLGRQTAGGRSHDIYTSPLPDGGYVVSAIEATDLLAARADKEAHRSQTANALARLRIGLAIFDANHRLLLANPRFAALLGLPEDMPVVGSSLEDMLALMETQPEFANPDGAKFLAAMRKGASGQPWQTRRNTDDGRSIDVMFDPLPDGGCTIAVNDITAQAHAEDDANRRARLLDQVLLNVPHGICVYGPDRRLSMLNDTYNRVMAGAPVRVGETLAEVIRRRAEAGEYGEGDPDTVVEEQMAHDISRPQMRRRVRPNGTAIDVRTAPLPDGGHISVVTDISALVQAEAELRRRAEDMSTMLNNIRHGIMLWGQDRRLVASNPVAADLLDLPPGLLTPGRSEAEVIRGLADLGHFGSDAELAPMAQLLQDLDRAIPFGREVSRSGRVLFAQSNPAPGGGWITTFTDITRIRETEQELRRAKERAEAANLAKSRFLATMSHELRTPLNAIIGFSDALARETGDVSAELVAEYSSQINGAGKQLLSLINIILDVARIESGRFDPDGDIVDIGKVIRSATRQIDSAAQAGEVAVGMNIPSNLPPLRGDERRLTQALTHLLSNGVKFTEAGGSVTVNAGLTAEADVRVAVEDTGIGIPTTDLDRAFEPFTQLDDGLSRRYPGAGLGLFIARAIVAAHGGALTLTSRPGAGTTAQIILPSTRVVTESVPSGEKPGAA